MNDSRVVHVEDGTRILRLLLPAALALAPFVAHAADPCWRVSAAAQAKIASSALAEIDTDDMAIIKFSTRPKFSIGPAVRVDDIDTFAGVPLCSLKQMR
jgi:hypothetical protein